jgi:hypothetical protein
VKKCMRKTPVEAVSEAIREMAADKRIKKIRTVGSD